MFEISSPVIILKSHAAPNNSHLKFDVKNLSSCKLLANESSGELIQNQ